VPPGWTDWHGAIDKSTYQMWGYKLYENGVANTYGDYYTEDPALYQTDVLRDKALEAIRARAGGERPFFLSLMFVAPHGEVVPPSTTTQPHIRPAPRHAGRFATLPLPRDPAFDEMDISDKPPEVRRLRTLRPGVELAHPARLPRAARVAAGRRRGVGALVGELGGHGQLGLDLHPVHVGQRLLPGRAPDRQGQVPRLRGLDARLPLLMRGPGIPAGTVSGESWPTIDLAPTISRPTGATADLPQDGRSLLPYARDGRLRSERPILHEGLGRRRRRRRDGRQRRVRVYYAIRTARYLYVKWRGGRARALRPAARPLTSCARATPTRATRPMAEQLSLEVKRIARLRGRGLPGRRCRLQLPTRRAGEVAEHGAAASRARTRRSAPSAVTGMRVSKPACGAPPTKREAVGAEPARTSQEATSVAPFQHA
jgi:hypothetical protein